MRGKGNRPVVREPTRILSIHQPVQRLGWILHWRTDVFQAPRAQIISQLLLDGNVVASRTRALDLEHAPLREQLFAHHRQVMTELHEGHLDQRIRHVAQDHPRTHSTPRAG
ncbi:MAG: hypothetical protein AB2A00_41055 [Myxococcota bacterium]